MRTYWFHRKQNICEDKTFNDIIQKNDVVSDDIIEKGATFIFSAKTSASRAKIVLFFNILTQCIYCTLQFVNFVFSLNFNILFTAIVILPSQASSTENK